VILAALLALAAFQAEPIKCKAGPVDQSFGGTEWQVYACDDGRSVLTRAKGDNPAAPFYFIIAATEKGHEIYGEGTGDKAASDAAYAALQKLDEAAIAKLYAQATAAAAKP
jgi:hypothetical protein